MNNELSKTIIRIIQDYCFESSAQFLCSEFALALTPNLLKLINGNNLNLNNLYKIAKLRKDFFVANNLDFNNFCKGLFKKLDYELSFYERESFLDSIKRFKRKMENGNFRGFSKENVNEDTLRSTLTLFLKEDTFCEARTAAGNSDIIVSSEKVIIETKIWNGTEYYNAGFPELNEYLEKINYKTGYYIIFDYNKYNNQIIEQSGEVFEITYKGHLIHVIFIRMNSISPSKKYKIEKNK